MLYSNTFKIIWDNLTHYRFLLYEYDEDNNVVLHDQGEIYNLSKSNRNPYEPMVFHRRTTDYSLDGLIKYRISISKTICTRQNILIKNNKTILYNIGNKFIIDDFEDNI